MERGRTTTGRGEFRAVATTPRAGRAARAGAATLPFPRGRRGIDLAAVVSLRAVGIGVALVLAAGATYLLARETSAFSVRRVEVEGARPAVVRRVTQALRPVVGRSLVSLSAAQVEGRVSRLPDVVSARVDRSFPATLKVYVRAERPVAVVRQGAHAWLASARARVLRALAPHAHPSLPRVWLPATADVSLGATLADGDGAQAVRALAPLRDDRFRRQIRFVRADGADISFVLRSGVQLELGAPDDLSVKLAIARRAVVADQRLRYVDVSLPSRIVTGESNPQVESRALGSATG
jgi:cell division protein FtsQ